jgi:hypothetical protein
MEIGSDRLQKLSDERVKLIGIDPIEGTGFVLHVTVERRIGDVEQLSTYERTPRACVGCPLEGRSAPLGRMEGLERDYQVEATSSPSGVTHVMFTRTAL